MCRRDSDTAMRCASRVAAAPVRFKKLPTRPLRTSASCSGVGCWSTESWLSWPSFSSRVMRATRESIFCSAAERCANAGPAQRARAAGNAVSKPLWGRIGIRFRKRNIGRRRPQSIRPSPTLTNPRVRVIRDANTCTGDGLMSRTSFAQLGRRLFLSLAFVVTAAPAAVSQTSTGSIRGYVTDSGGTPIAGARVTAVNTQTSAQREATTQSNGFYAILGLVPAEYEVTARQIGMAPQKIRVRVLIGEVFPLDLKLGTSASQIEAVTIEAAAGVETRTSAVATNATQR